MQQAPPRLRSLRQSPTCIIAVLTAAAAVSSSLKNNPAKFSRRPANPPLSASPRAEYSPAVHRQHPAYRHLVPVCKPQRTHTTQAARQANNESVPRGEKEEDGNESQPHPTRPTREAGQRIIVNTDDAQRLRQHSRRTSKGWNHTPDLRRRAASSLTITGSDHAWN